nr:integrase, catalytic region, zinc finger, CCHC-type, peptidase aspartic, catalytic [Tanacetum cinerariifolium]
KAKADIGIFVGYAPTKKAYRVFNNRTRKIQETIHVSFDELSGDMTSEQLSSGLDPNPMAPAQHSVGPELTALQSGRTRSALVNDPPTSSVPPTMKQFQELFQPMMVDEDEEFPSAAQIYPIHVNAAQAPEIVIATPSTTLISEGAPAVTISPSVSESSPQDYFVRFHKLINDMKDIKAIRTTSRVLTTKRRLSAITAMEKDMFPVSVEPKRLKDSIWHQDKVMLLQAKENGAILDAEAEAFLADVECTVPLAEPLALTTTNMFQVNHEDAYDSYVDDEPNAAAAFMANLLSSSSQINEVRTFNDNIF